MELLTLKISFLLIMTFLTGLGLGCFLMSYLRHHKANQQTETIDQLENRCVESNHENNLIKAELTQLRIQYHKAVDLLEKTSEPGNFLKVQKQLEQERQSIINLKETIDIRENQISHLNHIVSLLKENVAYQAPRNQQTLSTAEMSDIEKLKTVA